MEEAFTGAERDALYKAIFSRRDVRGQFLPDPIPEDVVRRILLAAHHAPSVGFMQPWNFLVITDQDVKARIHADFAAANEEAASQFDGERRALYSRLKLEGIREAPVNLLVTCDRERAGPVVLGRTHMPTMDLYSCVCAVQNLWLAARAEGLGVGWVSILHESALKAILAVPERIVPIAYLCVGRVSHFETTPELAIKGWRQRLDLDDLIFRDRWNNRDSPPD